MDTTEDNAKSQEGGTAWELQSAWDLIVAARQANDDDALELGWRRYSEGLRNSAIGAAGSVLAPLAAQIQQASTKIDAAVQQQDSRFSYVLDQLKAFLKTEDTRHDNFGTELNRVLAALEGTQQALGKALARADEAVAGVADLAGKVSNQGEQIDTLANRVALIEQTPGTYPDLLRGMQRLEKMVLTNGKKSDERQEMNDRRQTYLLIGLGMIVLLLVVASLVSLGG
jgi:hypothetical protein